jgi:ribonuclease G
MQQIRARGKDAAAPSRIHSEMGLLGRLVRDKLNDQTREVLIDSAEVFEATQSLVRMIAPQLEDRIRLYSSPVPLFEHHGITRDLNMAQERVVPLRSGGSIVIDEAEALCAIDVNTGKFTGKKRLADTVLQTNLEAVAEVARQLRLRDIGGVVVIDFIDMERRRDSVAVLDALEATLKLDQARTRIVQLSPSGLVELIRRREGQSLRQIVNRPCPYCGGDGAIQSAQTIAIAARRRVRELATQSTPDSAISVTLHPEVAIAFLGADGEYAGLLEAATAQRIYLFVQPHSHLESCKVELVAAEKIARPHWEAGIQIKLPLNLAGYPAKEPRFFAWQNVLLHIEQEPSPAGRNQPAVVQIEDTALVGEGRWFYRAKVLVWHEQSTPHSELLTDELPVT